MDVYVVVTTWFPPVENGKCPEKNVRVDSVWRDEVSAKNRVRVIRRNSPLFAEYFAHKLEPESEA